MASMLPIFLDLEHRPVLLVGGRATAREKLLKLLPTGAKVQVVARNFDDETAALLATHHISWQQRAFQPTDVAGLALLISAVDDAEEHARIAVVARQAGVLINAVDAPASCDFYFAAQVQRGPLQLAISTGGLFPGVAGAVRVWLEQIFPADMSLDLDELVKLRLSLRHRLPDPRERMRALRRQLQLWLQQDLPSGTGDTV